MRNRRMKTPVGSGEWPEAITLPPLPAERSLLRVAAPATFGHPAQQVGGGDLQRTLRASRGSSPALRTTSPPRRG